MKLDFDCNSFAVYWVGKVTTRTYNFVLVIASFNTWTATELAIIMQFPNPVQIRLISQLISSTSRVLKKISL